MDYDQYLQVGLKASKLAGQIIRDEFSRGSQIFDSKPDNSPVTKVDKLCEEVIKKTILESFPDHSFYGEEFGKSANDSDFVWIIDPIDGTKNFVRNIPLFASLIALMHQGELVVGISNSPIMGELFYASKSKGAYNNGQTIHVSQISSIADAFIGHGSIRTFNKAGKLENLRQIGASAWGSKGIGDAWAYHLVARGAFDANFEASLKIWDIAAPSVIITEAGGRVSDLDGKPISLDTTSFLASNGLIHDQLLETLK